MGGSYSVHVLMPPQLLTKKSFPFTAQGLWSSFLKKGTPKRMHPSRGIWQKWNHMKSCSRCSNQGSNLVRFITDLSFNALILWVLQFFFFRFLIFNPLIQSMEKESCWSFWRSSHPDRHKSSWRNILGDREFSSYSIQCSRLTMEQLSFIHST